MSTTFNAEESNPYADIDMWKTSIEVNENRPLTMNEYEQWYEVVANCEMNSQVHYINYLRDYHDKYNRYIDEPETETDNNIANENIANDIQPVCSDSFREEQIYSKLAEVTSECNQLRQENEHYKTMLNNYQNNYAYSPTRPSRSSDKMVCPPRPERKINKKNVRFIHGTPARLFPVKSERTMKINDIHPNRLRRIQMDGYIQSTVESLSLQTPIFYKASELLKKKMKSPENPHDAILSEEM